ncbi:sugar ABC transporter substrate-binding protein [Plantactinospora endophytica]|uniref:Sugar ABC transporter substrate-binding protein n=1 Tax=Plantactinospora endophytica TaxID=673535 RepID=A0ABQ4DU60_9ACTN|nr:maltose ABC transporter substrate-binding protein [Plantactinospora endophytica]GIG85667.1 sugar ABC transporter substrate-binding protein [Plantactinospora endophytica]
MRIRTAGVVAAMGLALAGAGCGSDTPSAEPSATAGAGGSLMIWADDKRTAALKPLVAKFGQELGVTIEIQAVSEDLHPKFVTASQSGNPPDIMIGAHDWIGNLVQNGAIDPIQLTDAQRGSFAEIAVKGVTFNGQVYGVPYAVENLALFRNTELAPQAPATLEELVAAGKQLKQSGKATEILSMPVGQVGDAYHMYPLYTSGGGYLFGVKPDGEYDPKDVGVGNPASIAAFEKIRKLGEKGDGALKRSIGHENALSLFTGKKAAFMISGPWSIADVKKAGVKYEIEPIPGFAGAKPAQPFVGVQAFYVAAKGKNKAIAQEFVANYVTKPELAKVLYDAEPRPPALTAAFDQVKASDPDVAKIMDAGKGGAIMPAIPAMANVWDPFGKASAAIVGGAAVPATVTAAGKSITDKIK